MKKIELSEDFFAAGPAGGTEDRPGEEGTLDILLGRNPSNSPSGRPRTRTRAQGAATRTPPPSGITDLINLPFDLTRNLMTVLVLLFRASVPTLRRR
ncbi:MAG: hypothetical protein Kow001_12260 [Acidobacteriota bacterium]